MTINWRTAGVAGISAVVYTIGPAARAESRNRPNIIFIVTDDHGYTDLGSMGVDPYVQTPFLDEIASNGVRFTEAYCTAPQCRPSRAGMLTGRYQNRFGYTENSAGAMPLLDSMGERVVTIAERIRDLGYRTGLVGKWHLSPVEGEAGYDSRIEYDPDHRGFVDQFDGTAYQYMANFDLNGNTIPRQLLSFDYSAYHRVDLQSAAARAFIQRSYTNQEPFFLYVGYYAPHIPLVFSADTNYFTKFPANDYPEYKGAEDYYRRAGLAMIKAIDTGVGSILGQLRQLNIETNTLILFTSDNGAPLGLQNDGSRNLTEWDGSDNRPLRGTKGSTWEGGIRIPMLMYWKNMLPEGLVYTNPVLTVDLSATAVEVAGGLLPSLGYDGVNLFSYLNGEKSGVPHESLFWNYGITGWGDTVNVRRGNWKLHRFNDKDFLFDVENDPEESVNLADAMPMKVAELGQLANRYLSEMPLSGVVTPGSVESTTLDAIYRDPIVETVYSDGDGDGMSDRDESAQNRNPDDAADLAFEFNVNGYLENWVPVDFLNSYSVTNGTLNGQAESSQGKFEIYDLHFGTAQIENLIVRLKSPIATALTFRWGTTESNFFSSSRTSYRIYQSNIWQTVVIPLKTYVEWAGHTITCMRLNPVNTATVFEVDWIRGSSGDLDKDLVPDSYEWQNGLDAGDSSDGQTDGDGDGMTYGQEYIAGTSDADANSVLFLKWGKSVLDGYQVFWDGKANRRYTLTRTENLIQSNWIVMTNLETSVDTPLSFSVNPLFSNQFYRVKVELQ